MILFLLQKMILRQLMTVILKLKKDSSILLLINNNKGQFSCPTWNLMIMKKIAFKRYIACLLMLLVLGASNQVLAMLSDAQAVNKAGLQRMLSQRIARNFLMVGIGIDNKKAQKELDENMALFEQNLIELQEYATHNQLLLIMPHKTR